MLLEEANQTLKALHLILVVPFHVFKVGPVSDKNQKFPCLDDGMVWFIRKCQKENSFSGGLGGLYLLAAGHPCGVFYPTSVMGGLGFRFISPSQDSKSYRLLELLWGVRFICQKFLLS